MYWAESIYTILEVNVTHYRRTCNFMLQQITYELLYIILLPLFWQEAPEECHLSDGVNTILQRESYRFMSFIQLLCFSQIPWQSLIESCDIGIKSSHQGDPEVLAFFQNKCCRCTQLAKMQTKTGFHRIFCETDLIHHVIESVGRVIAWHD